MSNVCESCGQEVSEATGLAVCAGCGKRLCEMCAGHIETAPLDDKDGGVVIRHPICHECYEVAFCTWTARPHMRDSLNGIADCLERIEKALECQQNRLDDISETLSNILANDRGAYNL